MIYMNRQALKRFAMEGRRDLRNRIKIKASQYGIEEGRIDKESIISSDGIFIDGKRLSIEEQKQRNKLIGEINLKGYDQVIEEVAYTWFNRFTALRFMEVNDFLPIKVRVLSSTIEGSYEPDIIREALNIDLDIDKEYVYNLKMRSDIDGLYKYLIIKLCNSLHPILPFMFEEIPDHIELLFPDGLLSKGSFLRAMTDTDNIPEEDWKDVEILGWLYQYYIAEENDRVIRAKKRYEKEEIPYATQLFTPKWIVKYMVQNALGRFWIESHPEDRDLIRGWDYYLGNTDPQYNFEEKLVPHIDRDIKVEDIKCFDPAMGSGHILVYMFDLLYEIYKRAGYMEREIPRLIIENNLYGLDIDDRAYQLACFALIMKAQQYNNRFLRDVERQVKETGKYIKLNLASIQETNDFEMIDIEYIAGEPEGENFQKVKAFIDQFKDAKIYGSLIEIKEFDEEFLLRRADNIINNPVERMEFQSSKDKVDGVILDLIKQAKIMTQTYHVLITNPPYIGNRYLNPLLKDLLDKNYPDVKFDLFSAFITYSFNKTKENGHLGFMSPFVWMFIKSYEKLRREIIDNKDISTLVQLEYSGFDGATVPICTFTLRNYKSNLPGEYIRLSDFKGPENQPIKVREAVKNPDVDYRYRSFTDNFKKIPGSPIAYWASNAFINIFQNKTLKDYSTIITGMTTGNNNLYLRFWHEVDINKINFNQWDMDSIDLNEKCWIPYNKGGPRRNWYGNNEYIVNWGQHEHFNRAKTTLKHLYLRKGITWPFVTSGDFSARFFGEGFLWDVAGSPCFFHDDSTLYYCLGFMCTKLCNQILKTINPTINVQAVDLEKLPIIYSKEYEGPIIDLVKENIKLSKDDWDSYERSWDFKAHPLVRGQLIVEDGQLRRRYKTIEEAFNNWKEVSTNRFNRLKANEEELNNIFNHIYGLEAEISPYVEDEYITVSVADRERDIKSFISYAIGCILGRYSLDVEGIAYAGGAFDINRYKIFPVEEDNILPVNSEPYFQNDAVFKLIDFVRTLFGEEKLSENLQYIAEALGIRGNETPRDTIRRYLLNDFYKDHVQAYNNRPIYWMFTSGKQKAFNALIYMHRYHSSTLSKLRIDYLHVLQARLEGERLNLVKLIEDMESSREKRQIEKEISQLEKQIIELKKYDDKLHHLADMMIEIDLDDGVRSNYGKFKGLLERI